MAAALALKAASVWAGTVVLNSEGLLATGPRAEATLAPRHVFQIIREDYLQPSHGGKSPQVSRGVQPACEFSKLTFHLSAHHTPIRACTQPSAGYPPPSHLLAVPHDLLATVRPPPTHRPSTSTPNAHPCNPHSCIHPFTPPAYPRTYLQTSRPSRDPCPSLSTHPTLFLPLCLNLTQSWV